MENLILIESGEEYMYSDLESLVKQIIAEDYYDMLEEEKKKVLEMKAVANTTLDGIKIEDSDEKEVLLTSDNFIIYDEFCYILSMCKFNKMVLLEKVGANIFEKYINSKNIQEGYIVINKFADEIMKNYLSR